VEQAFRTCKTAHLETRPLYVRTPEHTRAHVLVVMLAYLLRRELSRAWSSLDVTVEEGLHQLQTLCSTEIRVQGGSRRFHHLRNPLHRSIAILACDVPLAPRDLLPLDSLI